MKDILEMLKEIALKNKKFFSAVILMIIILGLILFPYFDANFLVFDRIAKRIDNLDKISKIDLVVINQNPLLLNEYENIMSEINNIQTHSIAMVITQSNDPSVYNIKFASGGIVFWLLAVFYLVSKSTAETSFPNKIFGIVFLLILGWCFAYIATLIPTFGNIWVNTLLFPIILITIMGLLVYGFQEKSKR